MTEATFLEEQRDPRMEAITVDELCQACGFIFDMKTWVVLKNLSGFDVVFVTLPRLEVLLCGASTCHTFEHFWL